MVRKVYLALLVCAATLVAQPIPHPSDSRLRIVVATISADSIYSYINALSGFQTRHTYSDTSATGNALGGAIAWVEQKVRAYDRLNRYEMTRFYWDNVPMPIVRVNSSRPDAGRYVIGGHLDSRTVNINDLGRAPGADDNASSCAVLLEILRVLPDTLDHDLEVIFFTGEEQGLLGSAAYAQDRQSHGVRIDGMIAMDMVSHIALASGEIDSVSCRLYAQGLASQGGAASPPRQWQRSFRWLAQDYADNFQMVIFPATDRPGRGSDHISFSEAGYPALRVIERNEDLAHQHNPNDLIEFTTPSYARNIALVTAGGLINCLQAPARPPAPRVEVPVTSLGVFIDDSVSLPGGGEFFLAIRQTFGSDYDTVINLGTNRFYNFDHGAVGTRYAFSVARSNLRGLVSPFSWETLSDYVEGADEAPLAQSFGLQMHVSPNPFNDELRIELDIPDSGPLRLAIYDILGREVTTLFDGVRAPGAFTAFWEVHDGSTGIYFARAETATTKLTQKILYIR